MITEGHSALLSTLYERPESQSLFLNAAEDSFRSVSMFRPSVPQSTN